MVIFEQTLRDLLIATNLVGSRVFLMEAPQKPAAALAPPYIVFFHVAPWNPNGLMAQTGPLDQNDRDYQISVFDLSQTRALAIADSLRFRLNGLAGDYQNVHIGHSFYMTQTWTREPDTLLFQVIQEYRIMFRYLNYDPPATPNRSTNRITEGAT